MKKQRKHIFHNLIIITLIFIIFLTACSSGGDTNVTSPGTETIPLTGTPGINTDISSGTTGIDITYSPVSGGQPTTPRKGSVEDLPRDNKGIITEDMIFNTPVTLISIGNGNRVRSGPNTTFDEVGTISVDSGHVALATEVVDGWYKVTISPGNVSGYLRSDLARVISNPTEKYNEPKKFMCNGKEVYLRKGPSTSSEYIYILGKEIRLRLSNGQVIEATEMDNCWYKVTVFPGMQQGYMFSGLVTEYDADKKFMAQPYTNPTYPNVELVDVAKYLPELEYDILFAKPDNYYSKITGNPPPYSRDVCMLQRVTVKKLKKAHEIFDKAGYTIKLFDGYRPSSVSGALYSAVPDSRYVAKEGLSVHNRGMSVDMTLIDKSTGKELEMPSKMHTFDASSHRNYSKMSATAKKNMDYMTSVMKQCGFTTISTEWWHFNDSDYKNYPAIDAIFDSIFMEPYSYNSNP